MSASARRAVSESGVVAHERAFGQLELQQLGGPAGVGQDLLRRRRPCSGSRTCRAARLTLISSRVDGFAACHRAAWRHASCSTARPSGTIRPVSSASGMNSSGGSRPPVGSCQRTSASTPVICRSSQPDQRLVLDDELAAGQGLRDPRRQREPVDVGCGGVRRRTARSGRRRRPWPSTAWCRRPSSARPCRSPPSPLCTIPMLADITTSWPPSTVGRRTEFSAAWATRLQTARVRVPARRAPRTRRRPSGPPDGRRRPRSSCSRCATACSRSSPLSWPRVSLMALKPSRSR